MTERKDKHNTPLCCWLCPTDTHSLTQASDTALSVNKHRKQSTSPTHSGHALQQLCLHPSKDQSQPSCPLMKVDPLFFFCPSVSKQKHLILSDANNNNNNQPKANPTSPPQSPKLTSKEHWQRHHSKNKARGKNAHSHLLNQSAHACEKTTTLIDNTHQSNEALSHPPTNPPTHHIHIHTTDSFAIKGHPSIHPSSPGPGCEQ